MYQHSVALVIGTVLFGFCIQEVVFLNIICINIHVKHLQIFHTSAIKVSVIFTVFIHTHSATHFHFAQSAFFTLAI